MKKMPANAEGKVKGIALRDDAFSIIDEKARYQIKASKLYLEIELPKDINEVMTSELLSSSGKTFRVYSNSTNRKFLKADGYKNIQIQINSYLSVKDAKEIAKINTETLTLIAERTKK